MKILDQLVGNFKNISVPDMEGGSILEFAWISIKIKLTCSENTHDDDTCASTTFLVTYLMRGGLFLIYFRVMFNNLNKSSSSVKIKTAKS